MTNTRILSVVLSGVAAVMIAVSCGDNVTSTADINAMTVDFGEVDCGTTPHKKDISIAQVGAGALHFTATLGMGAMSPFSISQASGTVTHNHEIQLVVVARAVPSDGGIAPITDTLTITTDAPSDNKHTIPLTLTPRGVVITVSTVGVAFPGTTKVGTPATTMPLTISNAGNATSTVQVAPVSADFAVDETPAQVAGGASIDRSVTFTPSTSAPAISNIVINATGPLCAPIPSVSASGQGSFGGTASDVVLVGGPGMEMGANQGGGVQNLCVRLSTGQVACIGPNRFGTRGDGANAKFSPLPTLVRTDTNAVLDKVVQIAGQRQQVCALRSDDSVWCWGNVGGSPIGPNRNVNKTGQNFATRQIASGATAMSMSYGVMCAIVNNAIQCLGQRATRWNQVSIPAWQTAGTTTSMQLALNGCGGYALQSDGTVQSFGANTHGVRAPGALTVPDNSPETLVQTGAGSGSAVAIANVVQIVAGVANGAGGGNACGGGCAILNDSSVQCWGAGRHGVGNNTTVDQSAAVPVLMAGSAADGSCTSGSNCASNNCNLGTGFCDIPLTGVTKMTAGTEHRCAITPTNVFCWGRGGEGQLGIPATGDVLIATPTGVPITDAAAISAMGRTTCVLHTNGTVTCFGQNGGFASLSSFNP